MFKLKKKNKNGIRIGELITPHGIIHTPFFMPVGTAGSVKGISTSELNQLGAEIILCNTYHLYLRPGEKLIKNFGGLHQFINWDKPILTDSGGYQVFSLAKNNLKFKISNLKSISNDQFLNLKKTNKPMSLVKLTDDGVEFKSHLDGGKHLFTPEKVIQIQLDLGVDILMPLDVCPSGKASYEEVKKATELTINWAKRAKKYFDESIKKMPLKSRPQLHGIVQGGLYEDLRKHCTEELVKLDFDGYSIGGLAVDYETRNMWEIVKLMGEILPENKQRYLMGVGTPDDIIKATKLGIDMFDCVLPTRLGRHGSVYQHKIQSSKIKPQNIGSCPAAESCFEVKNLVNAKFKDDQNVIESNCQCPACAGGYSRAYISHLIRSGEILGIRLTTLHNLYIYLELMRQLAKD